MRYVSAYDWLLTHCLICCPVETEAEALENDSDTPGKEMCPDMNIGHLVL